MKKSLCVFLWVLLGSLMVLQTACALGGYPGDYSRPYNSCNEWGNGGGCGNHYRHYRRDYDRYYDHDYHRHRHPDDDDWDRPGHPPASGGDSS